MERRVYSHTVQYKADEPELENDSDNSLVSPRKLVSKDESGESAVGCTSGSDCDWDALTCEGCRETTTPSLESLVIITANAYLILVLEHVFEEMRLSLAAFPPCEGNLRDLQYLALGSFGPVHDDMAGTA